MWLFWRFCLKMNVCFQQFFIAEVELWLTKICNLHVLNWISERLCCIVWIINCCIWTELRLYYKTPSLQNQNYLLVLYNLPSNRHLTLVWAYLLGCNRWWSCRNRHIEWSRLLFTSTQYFCVITSSVRTRIRNHRCKVDKICCLRYMRHCLNASYLNPCGLFAWNIFLLWKTAGVARAQCRSFLAMAFFCKLPVVLQSVNLCACNGNFSPNLCYLLFKLP